MDGADGADGDDIEEYNAPGEWVSIAAGSFVMGSPGGAWREPNDQHTVTLTRRFEMQTTEVTQFQFETVMGYNPSSYPGCGHCPVENVNWHEAAVYCDALSDRFGLSSCYECSGTRAQVVCSPSASFETPYACPGYRLPTEAEWEYAVRAGTTTDTYNGDLDISWDYPDADGLDLIAWYCGFGGERPKEVGQLLPNAWGLYDMLGNVREWCHDWFGPYPEHEVTDPWGPAVGDHRIFRGGSWGAPALEVHAAGRYSTEPEVRTSYIGFRPVRSLGH
jgi:formylglycine-generating enzyme required for sulfatase activity